MNQSSFKVLLILPGQHVFAIRVVAWGNHILRRTILSIPKEKPYDLVSNNIRHNQSNVRKSISVEPNRSQSVD